MNRSAHATPPQHGRAAASRRWLRWLVGALLALGLVVWFGNAALRRAEPDRPSVSHGTRLDGRLEHGKRLPSAGPNYRTYSRLGSLFGRTAVHGAVRRTLLDAFGRLARSHPDRRFVYGETGWPSGGRIRPHRTHRNGRSVDLMTPVRGASGPARLPTHPWTLWGYGLDYDAEGRAAGGALRVDFEALGALVLALDEAAPAHGLRIERVILAPDLQDDLFRAVPALRGRVAFSRNPSWVRHDDHVHVDFLPAP